MATTHTVEQGECLSSIAAYYGFPDWHVIYNHPNNADFRTLRPDPNLIFPGDQLYIPDFRVRQEACQTEMLHVFQVTFQPTYINVCIQDLAGQPMKNVRYQLVLGDTTIDDQTDSQGWITRKVPALSETGTLTVWPNPSDPDTTIEWPVELGHLDPLETTSGVKARLNNLGYNCGEVNSVEDDDYTAAVSQFQLDRGITVDGIVGPQTRGELTNGHLV
jgi:N-acetylmuramoyl-L-alanine amidase